MSTRALTAAEVSDLFGHRKTWIYDNWRRLVAQKVLPPPIEEAGHLVWDEAQFFAYRDKGLDPKLAAIAMGYRAGREAATAAIAGHADDTVIAGQRAQLNRRFSRTQEGQ